MKKYLFMFSVGCIIYPLMEVAFRGYTHFSMAVTGGAAVAALYAYYVHRPYAGIIRKSIAGSLIITTIELIAGVIFNMILHLNVWDYSGCPLNLWGQICLPFSIMWLFLSALFYTLCPYTDKLLLNIK